MMRHVFAVAAALFVVGCAKKPVEVVDVPPLQVSPGAVEFGRVWVGRAEQRAVRVANPARVSQELSTRVEGEFVAAGFPSTVAPGEEVVGSVTVTANAPGAIEGTLWLGDAGVALRANAEVVPSCLPSAACRDVEFDFDAGVCVEANSANGTSCTASFACFREAQCQQGECVGTLTTCNDGNPCTGDACGQSGCIHFDDTPSCPVPSDPCQAPSCDVATGCSSTPVVDGTPCGPRTCDTAAICLSGQCQTRPAPQTQACTDVVVGWPAGSGEVDGFARDARFGPVTSMVYHPSGDLFVVEALLSTTGYAGRIRRISRDGTVKTMAGVPTESATRDGFGAAARLKYAGLLGVDRFGTLIFAEANTLRRMTPSGLVSTICTGCLANSWSAFDPATGLVTLFSRELADLRFVDTRTGVQTVARATRPNQAIGLAAVISSAPLRICSDLSGSAQPGTVVTLTPRLDGGYAWLTADAGCEFLSGARRYLPDGRTEVLASDGPADDGPLTQVGLQNAADRDVRIAMEPDGGYALFDSLRFHVRRVEGGVMRTLAGPVPRVRRVDGVGAAAQLSSSPRAFAADDGGVVFIDGMSLRRLEASRVTTLVEDAGSWGADLAVRGDATYWLGGSTYEAAGQRQFFSVDQLTTLRPATAPTTQPVRSDARSICVGDDGGLLLAFTEDRGSGVDAGAEPFFYVNRIRPGIAAATGTPRAYVRVEGFDMSELFVLFGGEGNNTLLARIAAGDAGLPDLSDFYEESPGILVGVEGRRVQRLDTRTGRLTTLAELSETPTAIAPAPDGGAYVGVTHAILHVRLP